MSHYLTNKVGSCRPAYVNFTTGKKISQQFSAVDFLFNLDIIEAINVLPNRMNRREETSRISYSCIVPSH